MGLQNSIPKAGVDGLDKQTYGTDNPAVNAADGSHKDFNPFNTNLGGTPLKATKPGDKPYKTDAKITTKNDAGQPAVETTAQKHAPNGEKPTTASADASLKDLTAIIKKVDPLGTAQTMAKMITSMGLISALMKANAGGGAPGSPMAPSQANDVRDAFSGALKICIQRWGYALVMDVFVFLFKNHGIDQVDPVFKDIVKHAFADIVQHSIVFGESRIPVRPVPPVVYGNIPPPLSSIVGMVPDMYVQQYYDSSVDPYPGYIQWKSPDNTITIYTKRTSTQYPWPDAQTAVIAEAELAIARDLYNFIIPNYATASEQYFFTVPKFNLILQSHRVEIENAHMEANVGKNSSSNLMSNLGSILGAIGVAMQLAQMAQLPLSTLNVGSITSSIGSFSKNMAMVSMMRGNALGAFSLPSALGGLGGIGSLAGALGSAGISLPSIAAATGLSSLANGIGGVVSSIAGVSEVTNALQASGISLADVTQTAAIAVAASNVNGGSVQSISHAQTQSKLSNKAIVSTALLMTSLGVS